MSQEYIFGSCHCGNIRFRVKGGSTHPEKVARCNCSLCRRKGAVMTMVDQENFELLSDANHLGRYRWNTKVAEHFFCKSCGIYTHHRRRSDPSQFGINLGCVEGADPFSYETIGLVNGAALSVE